MVMIDGFVGYGGQDKSLSRRTESLEIGLFFKGLHFPFPPFMLSDYEIDLCRF
jgi:hypothetical protein